MSNPFHRLTHENKEQVIKYLKFFRAKKDSILRGLGNEFEDTKADRYRASQKNCKADPMHYLTVGVLFTSISTG